MKPLTTGAIIFSLVVCGCVRTVTTQPYRLNEVNSGMVYSLPKTQLQVTITYTIRSKTKLQNGVPVLNTKSIVISKPVVIQPLLVSDTNNTFVLSGEKLVKDARLDASFKFQVNDNQLLAGVTSEALDKSPEILQGLVSSGISIAKMIAVAGEMPPTPLKEIGERISQINVELASLAKSADPNTDQTEEKDIAYTRILDLADFKRPDKWLVTEISAEAAKLGDFGQAEVPSTRIELFVSEEQLKNANNKFFSETSRTLEPSVIYRVPTPVRVRVIVSPKNVEVFDGEIPFAQLGPFNKVEAKYKLWAKRKTQITFSPATGSIKEYGVEATSSAEAVAKALDTSLSKVQTTVDDIRKKQEATEAAKKSPEKIKLDELEIQRKLLEAESALFKAQQELSKLKSGFGSN